MESADTLTRELEQLRALRVLRRRLRGLRHAGTVADAIVDFASSTIGCRRVVLLLDERNVGFFVAAAWRGFPDSPSSTARIKELRLYRRESEAEAITRLGKQLELASPDGLPFNASSGAVLGILLFDAADPVDPAELAVLADESSFALEVAAAQRQWHEEKILFERQQHDLVELVATIEAREKSMEVELQDAQKFQQMILADLPAVDGFDLELLYRPLDMVGGDLYDVALVDRGKLRLFLADAPGHGVPASLATMFIKSEYESVKELVRRPREVLAALNSRMHALYRIRELHFTALCADIDLSIGQVTYASAAHPGPLLLRSGRVELAETGGTFIGLSATASFPEWRVNIDPGEAFYAYSDGLTEAVGPGGEAFGEQRMADAIEAAVVGGPAVGNAVWQAMMQYAHAGGAVEDDVTFIGLSRRAQ